MDPTTPTAGTGPSPIQVVQAGGEVKDARPKVRATFPSGSGWPTAVPIVVEFTESINEASIVPTTATGNDGRIILRVKGATQVLPCQYGMLAEGRMLVMRPVTALSNQQNPTYEVVMLPDGRDVDGVTFQVPTEGTVLAEFQVNQDASFSDGRILATLPRTNARDVLRESSYFVVFDRPANPATVTESSLKIRRQGGPVLAGTLSFPLQIVGIDDPRVVRFKSTDLLAGTTDFELVVDATITFGMSGKLDFSGRTPFAAFRTVGPAAPRAVEIGNAAPGFSDKINRANVADARLRVTTPDDAAPGDRVRARIYGGDAKTPSTSDLAFVERTADVVAAGSQMIDVDFAGALGTPTSPRFDNGSIRFAVQMLRGSQNSGFALSRTNQDPLFDVTPPRLVRAGPPGASDNTTLFTDQEAVAFYGTANERLSSATLVAGTATATMFASAQDGTFLMGPVLLGRRTAPLPYSLVVTDIVGNMALAEATGNIVQRGLCTGLVTNAQELLVEAYDQSTLLPIAGATVLVEPGAPVVPPIGRQVGATDASGRFTFSGLTDSDYTVTIVRAGFDLVTLYRTRSGFVSLPLRPIVKATATLQGMVTFQPSPGATALVSSSAIADHSVLGVRTTNAAPNTIPDTPITPNRPQVVTAFAGAFEPTELPAYAFQGFQVLGPTGLVPTPPAAPVAGGEVASRNIVLGPPGVVTAIAVTPESFAVAVGLDLTNLVGGLPRVRSTLGLRGFENQVLAGVGFATSTMGGVFNLEANFQQAPVGGLAAFVPQSWVLSEAVDTAGRVSRTRGLLNPVFGTVLPGSTFGLGAPPIPEITAPAGPTVGPPAVTFVDGLSPAGLPFFVAWMDITAEAGSGRRWVLLAPDLDGVGATDTVQFPNLAASSVAGLPPDAWTVRVEGRVAYLQGEVVARTNDDFVFAERFRSEVNYSRSLPVTFTIQ
ncbi:MAG: carboxypeptidase-like regulatory domain-containing protein [Planctomycetota bacterium]